MPRLSLSTPTPGLRPHAGADHQATSCRYLTEASVMVRDRLCSADRSQDGTLTVPSGVVWGVPGSHQWTLTLWVNPSLGPGVRPDRGGWLLSPQEQRD